jgi:hypothetical protein
MFAVRAGSRRLIIRVIQQFTFRRWGPILPSSITRERQSSKPDIAAGGRQPAMRPRVGAVGNFDARQLEPDHFYPEACFKADDVG